MSGSAPSVNRFLINPRYSIFYRKTKTFVWQEQVRPEHVVLFILAGNLEYELGHRAQDATQGHILLLDPVTAFTGAGRGVESLQVSLSPQLLLDYAVRMRLVGPSGTISFIPTVIKSDRRFSELSRNLKSEMLDEKAGNEIVVEAIVEQLVVHLLRNFCNMRRSEELELSRVGLIDRRIRRAVELMHSQLHRELSLKEIADASYLSPFHFARLFKKLTGTTPHAYLATLRTKQAQLLLTETDLSITEISARVGYASSSHFTQAFRQTTGVTPRAFRRALVTRQAG